MDGPFYECHTFSKEEVIQDITKKLQEYEDKNKENIILEVIDEIEKEGFGSIRGYMCFTQKIILDKCKDKFK